MAKVKTMRNQIDWLIDEYPTTHYGQEPKFVLLDLDNYITFRDELIALNLMDRGEVTQKEQIKYRDLQVLCCFDFEQRMAVAG